MQQIVRTKFILVAVPLPAEDVEYLVSRNLVVARSIPDTHSEVLGLFDKGDIAKGTSLLGVVSEPDEEMPPEEIALGIFDMFNPADIEQLPESSDESVWSKTSPQSKGLQLFVEQLDIFGVEPSERLDAVLHAKGFVNIQETEFGTRAFRDEQ